MVQNAYYLRWAKKGLLIIITTKYSQHDAYAVKAVDTTAAGDTFIGAFCFALLNNFSREECIDYAQKAAALSGH